MAFNLNYYLGIPTKANDKDGVAKIQQSLTLMATSLQSHQALHASALVGRKVLVYSSYINLNKEGHAKAAVDLPVGLSEATVYIYSERGELIKTISLGQPKPGFVEFLWDGTKQNNQLAVQGSYKISVKGIYEGKEVLLNTMTSANVDSVNLDLNGNGLKLKVAGIGLISLDEVRQISI